jgi:hypothetical protein
MGKMSQKGEERIYSIFYIFFRLREFFFTPGINFDAVYLMSKGQSVLKLLVG